MAIVLVWSS